MRKALKPGLKLALTLHHLAEGGSHAAIAAHYRLGRSTTEAIYDTLNALWIVLQSLYLKPPSGPAELMKVVHGLVVNKKISCSVLLLADLIIYIFIFKIFNKTIYV
ncbi:hypothetical protein EB796_024142 [Bugula neritina]|uniref:Uncharacterized protein n=1 Tax=Bugula neritina TaxID=10212 RepID=A0A7J7IVC7_BUGNE|nr:hypothetical protein EB796_024142 [Bugula neritina]